MNDDDYDGGDGDYDDHYDGWRLDASTWRLEPQAKKKTKQVRVQITRNWQSPGVPATRQVPPRGRLNDEDK